MDGREDGPKWRPPPVIANLCREINVVPKQTHTKTSKKNSFSLKKKYLFLIFIYLLASPS